MKALMILSINCLVMSNSMNLINDYNNNTLSGDCKKLIWISGCGSLDSARNEEYMNYLKASLYSAKKYAPSLVPIVIITSHSSDTPVWLQKFPNVHVVYHNLSFYDMLRRKGVNPKFSNQHGSYLRLDIPTAMPKILPLINPDTTDTDYVLYTDVDVLFLKDINSCSMKKPNIISMGPELYKNDVANSGVIYMNVSAMRKELPSLLAFANSKKWQFRTYDQQLILDYKWSKDTLQLSDELNWKGYWGPNDQAIIVHFHGLKPNQCLDCFLQYRKTIEVPTTCPKCKQYKFLWKYVPDDGKYYERILQLFYFFISTVNALR